MRVNAVDRLLLADRDPYRPVHLLRFIRLQYAFAISMMIVILFVGGLFWSQQHRVRDDCQQRNARNVVSAQVLEQLTAASRADGDVNQNAVWRQWAQINRQASLPAC